MSFDIEWTEGFKWWRKPLGYVRLMKARRKYGTRLGFKMPFKKNWLHAKRTGYQDVIRRLHNIHDGRRCFVLGNDNSLSKLDYSLLKNEITIGSNNIVNRFPEWGFCTSYLTFDNVAFCESNSRRILDLKSPVKIFGLQCAHCGPADGKTIFMDVLDNHGKRVIFSGDCSASAYSGLSEVFLNLQLAFHLGCNPVYVIGVENELELMNENGSENAQKQYLFKEYDAAAKFYEKHDRELAYAGTCNSSSVIKEVDMRSLFSRRQRVQEGKASFGIAARHFEEIEKVVSGKTAKDYSRKYYEKAVLKCKKGHPLDALDLLQKSLERKPNALALYLKASIKKSLGVIEEAEAIFREILSNENLLLDKNVYGGSHFHLGELNFKASEYSEAKAHFKTCLEAIPMHGKAKEYLRVITAERSSARNVELVEAEI